MSTCDHAEQRPARLLARSHRVSPSHGGTAGLCSHPCGVLVGGRSCEVSRPALSLETKAHTHGFWLGPQGTVPRTQDEETCSSSSGPGG